ncbi:MAG TPA: NAD(P)/FAD-dependent oxidoreductase [Solirubrobacteraceae bacterium]|nr:NAD(P)/FAD-dependent oxidoreductase [Solirubrobacteraceae bacterium]
MTVRATARGAERYPLEGTDIDVLICGASFAGLAVARELAGSDASALLVDRYEVGERATSACAAPTAWLEAMGVTGAILQELPYMRFTTPHGSVRYRLPWSWAAFDYRRLCELLYAQSEVPFETATVTGRVPGARAAGPIGVQTDRGAISARLVVDALGWRRVLGHVRYQPPLMQLSRGLEVHPRVEPGGDELVVWVDRGLARRGYAWCVPAGQEARVGACSYDGTRHVRAATLELAERLGTAEGRFQGNWFPHRLRDATEGGVFFAGDSAGHCFALSGEGIRTAFYFGVACGRELRAVLEERKSLERALIDYHAFSAAHRGAFEFAGRMQRLVPALPPRLLAAALRALGSQRTVDRAFGWYLDRAHPRMAAPLPAPRTAHAARA